MKYFLKLVLISCIWFYTCDAVIEYFLNQIMPMAVIKVPGIEVHISNNDGWEVIFKLLVAVLGTYAGIKVINRIVK